MSRQIDFTQKEIAEIEDLLMSGISIAEVARRYNVSKYIIDKVIKKNGINRPISNTEILRLKLPGYDKLENEICKIYTEQLIQCGKLGKMFNIGIVTVINILKRHGIERKNPAEFFRKYTLNEHYFDVIDSKEKAYMLGFLYSDGCVNDITNIKDYKVQISLQEEDKEILEKFKSLLNYTGELRKIEPPKKYPNRKVQYQLMIDNKTFYESVVKNGVVPRKSYFAEFPYHIDEKYYKSFILGVYDGDGCLYNYRAKNANTITFTGTSQLINSIGDIIEENLDIKKHVHIAQNSKIVDKNTRVLMFGGNIQVEKFLKWLYEDEPIYLQRKYNKYCSLYNVDNSLSD